MMNQGKSLLLSFLFSVKCKLLFINEREYFHLFIRSGVPIFRHFNILFGVYISCWVL